MMFMARINDKGASCHITDYDEDGSAVQMRTFFTLAVEQFRPIFIDTVKSVEIKGKSKNKSVADFNSASRVHGRCDSYFDINVPYTVLEDIAIGVQAGYIPKTTLIDLRIENCKNITAEHENQTGLFAYLKKQSMMIKQEPDMKSRAHNAPFSIYKIKKAGKLCQPFIFPVTRPFRRNLVQRCNARWCAVFM